MHSHYAFFDNTPRMFVPLRSVGKVKKVSLENVTSIVTQLMSQTQVEQGIPNHTHLISINRHPQPMSCSEKVLVLIDSSECSILDRSILACCLQLCVCGPPPKLAAVCCVFASLLATSPSTCCCLGLAMLGAGFSEILLHMFLDLFFGHVIHQDHAPLNLLIYLLPHPLPDCIIGA